LLNDDKDPNLDHITEIAQDTFAVPIALISLVDVTTQCFKSYQGIAIKSTPREVSFCGFVIANNPLVTDEPHLRFAANTCWRWLTTHWIFRAWK